jgi:hypothetical protein
MSDGPGGWLASKAHLAVWGRGRGKTPSTWVVHRIARAYGVYGHNSVTPRPKGPDCSGIRVAGRPPPTSTASGGGLPAWKPVEVDEPERILEREIRQLAGGVLGHPERTALDRSAEANLTVRLRSQERMFSRLRFRGVAGFSSSSSPHDATRHESTSTRGTGRVEPCGPVWDRSARTSAARL